jgi:hypothetical protein
MDQITWIEIRKEGIHPDCKLAIYKEEPEFYLKNWPINRDETFMITNFRRDHYHIILLSQIIDGQMLNFLIGCDNCVKLRQGNLGS